MRNNWDVNTAAQAFIRAHSDADRTPNAGNQGADYRPAYPVRGGRTLEASRVVAVRDVGEFLRGLRHQGPAPSNANLVQIFHNNSWDITTVINSVATRRSTLTKQEQDDAADPRVEDRVRDLAMRSAENVSLDSMSSPPLSDHERDERLAWFLSATGTQSWYSAGVALENAGWNVARALGSWLRNGGIREIQPPDTVADRGRRDVDLDAMPLLLPTANIAGHRIRRDVAPSRLTFTSGFASSLPRPAPPSTGLVDYEASRPNRRGYIIDEDRRPANLNCPDATKLRVECIRDLQYEMTEFQGQAKVDDQYLPFNWTDTPTTPITPTNTVEFDCSNPHHLNRWREEHIRRLTGELRRIATDPFNKYEKDWLSGQEAIRYEREFDRLATRNYPGARADAVREFSDGSNFPLEMENAELQALTNRFNRVFAGKTLYQKVKELAWGQETMYVKHFDEPRPQRSSKMIRSQRVRIRALCRQFMKPFNDPHGRLRDVDEEASESDSDFEEERRGVHEVEESSLSEEEDGNDEDSGNAGFFSRD
jgi:hypothetical protein